MLDYEELKDQVKEKLGIDLHAYKEQQMRRRINQWLERHSFPSYGELLEKLDQDQDHKAKFTKYLTINTSNFFRDTGVFQVIEGEVLPAISRGNRPKIWSAGASIGAEVYSIAMLMREYSFTPGLLLATDLDQVALEKAKTGSYLQNQVAGVPEQYLNKYFRRSKEGSFTINKTLKDQVIFQRHDLLRDPFQGGFELILCRNVFIYLTSETQKRLVEKFVKSLRPKGYFIVGSAEQIMDPSSFGLRRVSYCIYQNNL